MLSIRYDIIEKNMTTKTVAWLKENANTILITEEVSKKSKKLHHHVHFEYNCRIKIDSAIKKVKRKLQDIGYNNYYCKKVKDYERHLIYVLKDGNIVYSTMKQETINSFLNQTNKINKDKKLPVYKKLYNRWMEYEGKSDIYTFIYNTMVIDFDTFCRRQQILEYAAYILVKQSNGSKTREVLNQQFGIFDYAHAHEEKLSQWYKTQAESLE